MEVQVTFLGTGTSQGVPVIGCHCEVCTSPDPRDNRLRTSALVRVGPLTLAIDCGPDFRQQMLRENVDSLDAILITHEHNDHVIGLDDVRPFNFLQRRDMPVYATPNVALELRQRFAYAFSHQPYPGAPMIRLESIFNNEIFFINGIPVIPVEVMHGNLPVLGFRIGDFTYLTDVKAMSTNEIDKIKGCHTLVLNALHHEPHYSHLNLAQSLELIEVISPKRAFLTHMSHHMGLHAAVSDLLPPHVSLGYDGLTFLVP